MREMCLLKAKLVEWVEYNENPKQYAVKEHSRASEHASAQKSDVFPTEKGVDITLDPHRDGTVFPTPSAAFKIQHAVQKMRLPAVQKINETKRMQTVLVKC